MAVATFTPTIDSYIDAQAPNNNYGTLTSTFHDVMYLSGQKTTHQRSIANFDVSSLIGAAINSAKLRRHLWGLTSPSFQARLTRCTRPSTWTELGVTWNTYDGVNSWTTAGGDVDDVTPGKIEWAEPTVNGWHELPGLGPYVFDAITNRDGIVSIITRLVNETPGVNTHAGWESKDSPTNTWQLVVDYTSPDPGRRTRGILSPSGPASRPARPTRPASGPRPAAPVRPGRTARPYRTLRR